MPKDRVYADVVHGYLVSTIRMPEGFTYAFETNVRHPDGTWGCFVRGTNNERDALAAHAAALAFVRSKVQ